MCAARRFSDFETTLSERCGHPIIFPAKFRATADYYSLRSICKCDIMQPRARLFPRKKARQQNLHVSSPLLLSLPFQLILLLLLSFECFHASVSRAWHGMFEFLLCFASSEYKGEYSPGAGVDVAARFCKTEIAANPLKYI